CPEIFRGEPDRPLEVGDGRAESAAQGELGSRQVKVAGGRGRRGPGALGAALGAVAVTQALEELAALEPERLGNAAGEERPFGLLGGLERHTQPPPLLLGPGL